MSYNIVKKGSSTVLVHKFRDPNNHDKVVEKYLLSMGVQTVARHKEIRSQVNELAQEDRINFCQRSGLVVEVPEDVPRRKVATGDIREQPVKKERKPRKAKEPVETKKEWLRYPETGYRAIYDSERARFIKSKKVIPTRTKAQIDKRILKIRGDIKFSKSVVKHKKGVATFSKSQQISVNRDIDYHQSVIDNGSKAIRILQKQKSGMR